MTANSLGEASRPITSVASTVHFFLYFAACSTLHRQGRSQGWRAAHPFRAHFKPARSRPGWHRTLRATIFCTRKFAAGRRRPRAQPLKASTAPDRPRSCHELGHGRSRLGRPIEAFAQTYLWAVDQLCRILRVDLAGPPHDELFRQVEYLWPGSPLAGFIAAGVPVRTGRG